MTGYLTIATLSYRSDGGSASDYTWDAVNGFYFPGGQPASSTSGATFTAVSAAPEIDGSLAPQIGFLLGCLFLMFGRKKQNPDLTMSAC